MPLLRRMFFYEARLNQVWTSRSGLPPIKVSHISPEGDVYVVDANVAFPDCWGQQERLYASDHRQWRDRLSEEHRRLRK